MITFSTSPCLLKGNIVLLGDRLEALRLKGPPVETIRLEAEIDATDQLEFPDLNRTVVEVGLYLQLAAMETIVYLASGQLQVNNSQAQAGTLETTTDVEAAATCTQVAAVYGGLGR